MCKISPSLEGQPRRRSQCSAKTTASPPTEWALAAVAWAKAKTASRVVTRQALPAFVMQNLPRVASSASLSSIATTNGALGELACDRVFGRQARPGALHEQVRALERVECKVADLRDPATRWDIAGVSPVKRFRDGFVRCTIAQCIKLKARPLAKKWLRVGEDGHLRVDAAGEERKTC